MDLTVTETDLKQDLKHLGGFTSSAGVERLRNAELDGLLLIWQAKDWRFRYSVFDLVTVDGTLGPYTPPADYYIDAPAHAINRFRYWPDIQTIAPIKDTDTESWDVYYNVQDSSLYFRENPGSHPVASPLKFNYQAIFNRTKGTSGATLGVTLGKFPNDLYPALKEFVQASLLRTPQTMNISEVHMKAGYALVDIAWNDYSRGQKNPKTRAPRGLNGLTYDGIAEQITSNRRTIRGW